MQLEQAKVLLPLAHYLDAPCVMRRAVKFLDFHVHTTGLLPTSDARQHWDCMQIKHLSTDVCKRLCTWLATNLVQEDAQVCDIAGTAFPSNASQAADWAEVCSRCCLHCALARCLAMIASNWAQLATDKQRVLVETLDPRIVQV